VFGLSAAVRYLTIVPAPGAGSATLADGDFDRLGRAAVWFPVVGLALGVALALVDRVTSRIFPPLLGALLVVTVWKLVSGGLHLDGLADCLDGLAGRDAPHRLAIMRDSRIGAFGAIGLILLLMTELAALSELPPAMRWRTLLVAPTVARALPPLLARLFRPARADGHGAAFAAGVGRAATPVALLIAVAVAGFALGAAGIVAVAMAGVVAVALGRFMAGRLGGVTGDVLGAAIETGEVVVLLTVSAWVHARLT
jgi:adenosylcobinamide-GDP ribazoletransferase